MFSAKPSIVLPMLLPVKRLSFFMSLAWTLVASARSRPATPRRLKTNRNRNQKFTLLVESLFGYLSLAVWNEIYSSNIGSCCYNSKSPQVYRIYIHDNLCVYIIFFVKNATYVQRGLCSWRRTMHNHLNQFYFFNRKSELAAIAQWIERQSRVR